MDTYLTAAGFAYSFQPFTRFRDFDRQVKKAHPALLFLPKWYLKQDGNGKKFEPFMIPVHKGATTYRKVLLVAADSSLTTSELAGVTLAMTPVGTAGMAMLNKAIFRNNGIASATLNVITTARDSDALFALALGQVKAALISEDNLRVIGAINPQILKTVKTLAVSLPIPLPVLCYAKGAVAGADLDKLKKSLLAGKASKNTAQLMELLDIDAWQIPSL
jgi:ABC-type phosphate/phosphonate transport system substrate-binding protein